MPVYTAIASSMHQGRAGAVVSSINGEEFVYVISYFLKIPFTVPAKSNRNLMLISNWNIFNSY